jgi:hypothetical protein
VAQTTASNGKVMTEKHGKPQQQFELQLKFKHKSSLSQLAW